MTQREFAFMQGKELFEIRFVAQYFKILFAFCSLSLKNVHFVNIFTVFVGIYLLCKIMGFIITFHIWI